MLTVYIDSEIFYPGLLGLLYSNKAATCIVQEASVMDTEESGSWQSWGRVDASLTLVYFLVKLSYIFWRLENETSDVNKALFSNYPSPYLEFHKSQYDNYYDQLSLSAICSSHNLDPEPLLWQETHLLTVIINTSMSILQDNLHNENQHWWSSSLQWQWQAFKEVLMECANCDNN